MATTPNTTENCLPTCPECVEKVQIYTFNGPTTIYSYDPGGIHPVEMKNEETGEWEKFGSFGPLAPTLQEYKICGEYRIVITVCEDHPDVVVYENAPCADCDNPASFKICNVNELATGLAESNNDTSVTSQPACLTQGTNPPKQIILMNSVNSDGLNLVSYHELNGSLITDIAETDTIYMGKCVKPCISCR